MDNCSQDHLTHWPVPIWVGEGHQCAAELASGVIASQHRLGNLLAVLLMQQGIWLAAGIGTD